MYASTVRRPTADAVISLREVNERSGAPIFVGIALTVARQQ